MGSIVDNREIKFVELPYSKERIYLFVAGTLYEARGLSIIKAALEENRNLFVICAGWLYDDFARAFADHEKVNYIGVVTPEEALSYAGCADNAASIQ